MIKIIKHQYFFCTGNEDYTPVKNVVRLKDNNYKAGDYIYWKGSPNVFYKIVNITDSKVHIQYASLFDGVIRYPIDLLDGKNIAKASFDF